MKIVSTKNGTTLTFPGGATLAVGTSPVEVPESFESEVRQAAAYSNGWRIVVEQKPAPKPGPVADGPRTPVAATRVVRPKPEGATS